MQRRNRYHIRDLQNEKEVIGVLHAMCGEKYDVQVFTTGHYNKDMRRFRNAAVVMAVHGGSLANIRLQAWRGVVRTWRGPSPRSRPWPTRRGSSSRG